MFFECSIDWCDRPVHALSYCGAHYRRSVTGTDMNAPHRHKRSGMCNATGCERPDSTGGFCPIHYWRKRNGRDMDAPIRLQQKRKQSCCVSACERVHFALGYCEVHYARLRRLGTTETTLLHARIEFDAAHSRVQRLWGRAAEYLCVECGLVAAHWAYDGTDPSQLFGYSSPYAQARGMSKMFYSRYPEFYMPMCAGCHRRRDGKIVRRELEEYRSLKHETGLTYEEISSASLRAAFEGLVRRGAHAGLV